MAKTGWFSRFMHWLNSTYEQRIKAASEVYEYGAGHEQHHHAPEVPAVPAEEEDEGTEIVNVPPGTRIR
jgi:hypothetical protein